MTTVVSQIATHLGITEEEATVKIAANTFPVVVRDGVIVPFCVLHIGLDVQYARSVARELISFALNQLGQNCAASAKTKCGDGAQEGAIAAKARELWTDRANNLYAGVWSKKGGGTTRKGKGDPVEKEARILAKAAADLKLKITTKSSKTDVEKRDSLVDKIWPQFRERAERIVADRTVKTDDIDWGDDESEDDQEDDDESEDADTDDESSDA